MLYNIVPRGGGGGGGVTCHDFGYGRAAGVPRPPPFIHILVEVEQVFPLKGSSREIVIIL